MNYDHVTGDFNFDTKSVRMPLPVCFRDENEKSKFEEVYADINRRTAKSGNLILEICKSHVHCNPVTETRPKRKKRPFLVTSTPRDDDHQRVPNVVRSVINTVGRQQQQQLKVTVINQMRVLEFL